MQKYICLDTKIYVHIYFAIEVSQNKNVLTEHFCVSTRWGSNRVVLRSDKEPKPGDKRGSKVILSHV